MSIQNFLKTLKTTDSFAFDLAHHEKIEQRESIYSEPASPLLQRVELGLSSLGVNRLYKHQTDAINLLRDGKNVVAVTPTASGKSLLYNIPVIEYLADHPDKHAIYLFPLKALEQDQAKKLNELLAACGLGKTVRAAIYDGDTPSNIRSQLRKRPPNVLITNPDMLNLSIMSYHSSWEDLLRGLKFIVIDELHIYRGIFGSQILHLLHRLLRLCRYYGVQPQIIGTSATIAGAKELAEDLTGLPFEIIENSGAPQTKRHFLFFNPNISYISFALKLFIAAIQANLKVIAFTKARRTTELMQLWLNRTSRRLGKKVSAYRAGYTPEERREIESKLISGELNGVISTSALELGIDIGGLDVCIMVGYPGTISATWQRAGRVGRGSEPAVICLVAGQDQLDQYFMRNPQDFFSRPVEKAIVDPANEYMLKPHLLCAAQEAPIHREDPYWDSPLYKPLIKELSQTGKLLLSASGDRYFSASRRPQREIDIRSAGEQLHIEIENSKSTLGSVSGRAVFAECHPGAIYLHRAVQYLVKNLNLQAKKITVANLEANYYTNPLFEKDTEILEEFESKELKNGIVKHVKLKVTEQLVGYQKRRFTTQELISQHELEFPPTSFETIGLAVGIPEASADVSAEEGFHFRGGIHGVEHSLLALAPLFALCDRNDMGGYSQVNHPQLESPAVFLYDGYPGGIGLCGRLFEVFPDLVERTLKLVSECPCESGCPSCIHSPKCGHGNIPLDKGSAVLTLEILAGRRILPQKGKKQKSSRILKTKASLQKPREEKPELKIKPVKWSNNLTAVIFDVETQRSADEVGGWGNIKAMGLAWAVGYKYPDDEWFDFSDKDVDKLIELLKSADVVVGFNQIRFDYEVLRGYSGHDFRKLPSYDILVEVTGALGHRLKLDSLASGTLGVKKIADGLQSLEWYKQGEMEKIAEYCRYDVEVTRDLFFYLVNNGYLLFEKKGVGLVRVPLTWDESRYRK